MSSYELRKRFFPQWKSKTRELEAMNTTTMKTEARVINISVPQLFLGVIAACWLVSLVSPSTGFFLAAVSTLAYAPIAWNRL